MKRSAAHILLVGILLIVALGLGVAKWIRTDHRTSKVAESLTRNEPPKDHVVIEGPGAASTSEPGQAVGEEHPPFKESTTAPKAPASMDWAELRKAVLAADATRVTGMRGKVGPADAATIYALLQEIPADAREFEQKEITSALARLLLEIETEESSGYLFTLLTQGAVIEVNTRDSILWQLGLRKHAPATSTLEINAFEDIGLNTTSERRALRYHSMGALLHLDPERYLSRVSQELRSVPDTNLWCLSQAFRTAAMMGKVDIAPAVPDLQAKFVALPRENWWSRKLIGEALAEYANTSQSKSQSVKTWLLREVKGLLDPSVQAGMDDASRQAYQALLKFAETGEGGK